MIKTCWLVFYTEICLLLRRSHEWLYPLCFFIIIISLFPLAFSPAPDFIQSFFPGCVWIAALFASVSSVQTIFLADLEEGHLEQLVLGKPPLTLVLLSKIAAHWLVTVAPLILLTPIISWIFSQPQTAIFALIGGLLLGTPILTLIGVFSVALTLGLRQQGVLLGLFMIPLTIPVLIFGVNMVTEARAGLSILGPLAFLAGLLFAAISLMPIAIATTIRLGLDD